MHLTTFTDYSLRVLMYLKINDAALATVAEISQYFDVSQNHIVKVVNNLSRLGLIQTQRGKGGGIRLLEAANQQKIGSLVRELEPTKEPVQCINKEGKECAITHACKLNSMIDQAMQNFFDELDNYTLDDIVVLSQPSQPVIQIKTGIQTN